MKKLIEGLKSALRSGNYAKMDREYTRQSMREKKVSNLLRLVKLASNKNKLKNRILTGTVSEGLKSAIRSKDPNKLSKEMTKTGLRYNKSNKFSGKLNLHSNLTKLRKVWNKYKNA
jgi:hypothetical protein